MVVAPVKLLADRYALLDAEHLVAQRDRGLEFLLAAHPADLEVTPAGLRAAPDLGPAHGRHHMEAA